MSDDRYWARHRLLTALIDKFAAEREAAGEPFHEIRELVGSIAQYHPVLRTAPDNEEKLRKAYEFALRLLPSEAESKSLLGDVLARGRSNDPS